MPDVNPNSSDAWFARLDGKLDNLKEKQEEQHTEFMTRFNRHEAVDDARHESNTKRLSCLEDDKRKVIGAVTAISVIAGMLHWFIDFLRK